MLTQNEYFQYGLSTTGSRLIIVTFVLSWCLVIIFNKITLDENVFPFAFSLVFVNRCVSSAIMAVWFHTKGYNHFPSIKHIQRQNSYQTVKVFAPIALCFFLSTIFSFGALKEASVSFYVLVNRSALPIVYAVACFFQLEKWDNTSVLLLSLACCFSGLGISGEVSTSLLGCGLVFGHCFLAWGNRLQKMALMVDGKETTKDLGTTKNHSQTCDPYTLIYMENVFAFIFSVPLPVLEIVFLSPHLHTDLTHFLNAFFTHYPLIMLVSFTSFFCGVSFILVIKVCSAAEMLLLKLITDGLCFMVSAHVFNTPIQVSTAIGFIGVLVCTGLQKYVHHKK
jgi:hypothetical protein